jgi:exopolysaccharide production protein ExoZ
MPSATMTPARDTVPLPKGITRAHAARYETIQVLRGIAASIVVFHHMCWVITSYHHGHSLLANLRRLPEIGASGVDIFFCISGVVIAQSAGRLSNGSAAAVSFFFRRITRVYPIYWIFATVLFALWAVHLAFAGMIVTPGLVISSYLLIPYPKTTVYGDFSVHPVLDVGWTLTFEIYFYLVCTAVIWWRGGRSIWPVTLLMLAGIAVLCLAIAPQSIAASVLTSPLLIEFCFGVALVQFRNTLTPNLPAAQWLGLALMIGGGIAILLSALLPNPMHGRLFVWGVPGALMVWGAMLCQIDPARRVWRLPLFLGEASYTIYLAHPLATLVLGTLLKRSWGQHVNPDMLILVGTAVIVLLTASTCRFVEQPITRWAQLLVSRRKSDTMKG